MPSGTRKHYKGLRRASPVLARRFHPGQPISKIDTRPLLIVVMIVATFFLIAASHITPHAFYIGLWDGETKNRIVPSNKQNEAFEANAPINRVSISQDDVLTWNGTPVSQNTFFTLLREVQTLDPLPVIEFEPDPNASYGAAVEALHYMAYTGSRFRIAGTEEHCQFWDDRFADLNSSSRLAMLHSVFVDIEEYLERYHSISDHSDCEARYVVHKPD